MNGMPCGLEDDRIRFEPDAEEDSDPRTDLEKRLSWLCDEWKEALEYDDYEHWHDMRVMIYGATQALIRCSDRFDDHEALRALSNIAFLNSLDCIRREAA